MWSSKPETSNSRQSLELPKSKLVVGKKVDRVSAQIGGGNGLIVAFSDGTKGGYEVIAANAQSALNLTVGDVE